MKITGQMHFAKALVELKKRGVAMKDVKPEELYALAEASRRCADPFREVNADAAGFPVRVSEGGWFWKLTIGAGVWLDEVEEMLGGGKTGRTVPVDDILAHQPVIHHTLQLAVYRRGPDISSVLPEKITHIIYRDMYPRNRFQIFQQFFSLFCFIPAFFRHTFSSFQRHLIIT